MATAGGRSPLLTRTRLIGVPRGTKMFQFPRWCHGWSGLPGWLHPCVGTRTAGAATLVGVVVVLLGWDIRVLTGPSRLWLGIRLTLVAVCVLWLTRSVWVTPEHPA